MNNDMLKSTLDEADCLIELSAIEQALDKMAEQLNQDYTSSSPVFLCVMNGGLVFSGHLLTRLNFPLEVAYCHATRYRGETSGRDIHWRVEPSVDLSGRHVIVVDDILDEGHTLIEIVKACENFGALSVKTAVLVDKQHDRKATENLVADYCELTVEDRYVFGFGMDYKHYWRNAPGIFAVKGM
ncbi:hypoxanthine-guanine phosphoribosyltransferase [Pleionea sp. CnH1-48]|uniref:hypoxanthine-guanine phosphoribosyltransferase n=1 Tax=Pleionea sp. CnH1-48 TaxID=2954494 RepID=UPI002096E0BB|nr:hypoxanthine-guanine phosphoribosyltransferase [Pleionea sp. CnH1-48]MCO7227082.1 hypoxanthine-guanine phosphoribosyltransferase [Pleionea sp. CnH1-48]